MKKRILTILTTLFISYNNFAQEIDSTQLHINQIEQSLIYKTGIIELESGNATLKVPDGFRYLDKEQSIYVLTDLWGNPVDSSILGMLIPTNRGVLADDGWAFVISYEDMGYVKDDDANDIDYDDLLNEMKKETDEANPERIKLGYRKISLVGWASKPFYDKELKTLHWAQEMKFGDMETNTLNYNLRILGRNGVLNLNAVSTMNELSDVKSNINKIIKCVEYKDGDKYSDFNPEIDNVAAWTIGGLVAGKVLTKVGFFALLLKFWKLILLGIASASGVIWRFLSGRKKDESTNGSEANEYGENPKISEIQEEGVNEKATVDLYTDTDDITIGTKCFTDEAMTIPYPDGEIITDTQDKVSILGGVVVSLLPLPGENNELF